MKTYGTASRPTTSESYDYIVGQGMSVPDIQTDRLIDSVYSELRALARVYLRRERANHTLQATALVHETYLQLADSGIPEWHGRAHFMAIAARAMRQILVRYARSRLARKRGGRHMIQLSLDGLTDGKPHQGLDILALNDALEELHRIDPRASRIVELRFFGGLTHQETAQFIGVSEKTVRRDWVAARAWLLAELKIV